jgi:hypothetical protein
VVVPAGVDECEASPPRLYMTYWDHNRARPKSLGKPTKEKALLEECWWDSQGHLNCSCNRGRLARDAPCVHKLVLAALGAPGSEQRGLPTAKELEREAGLVEQVGADSMGRFYAARSSPKGVSPAHKMLHRSVEGGLVLPGEERRMSIATRLQPRHRCKPGRPGGAGPLRTGAALWAGCPKYSEAVVGAMGRSAAVAWQEG